MNDYLQQRDAILKNQALSEQDRQKQVNDIKQKSFDQQEQIRVDALETIHDQGLKTLRFKRNYFALVIDTIDKTATFMVVLSL